MKNRIHALLKFYGKSIPTDVFSGKWSKKFLTWLTECQFEYDTASDTLEHLLTQLTHLRSEEAAVVRELRKRGKEP